MLTPALNSRAAGKFCPKVKGQLISKCLFGVFNSPPKTNENHLTFFFRFLGELKMPKRHFSKLTDFISSDLSKHLHGVGSGSLSQKSDVKSSLEAQNTWKDICRRDKDIFA